jgi:hypothetical protein
LVACIRDASTWSDLRQITFHGDIIMNSQPLIGAMNCDLYVTGAHRSAVSRFPVEAGLKPARFVVGFTERGQFFNGSYRHP